MKDKVIIYDVDVSKCNWLWKMDLDNKEVRCAKFKDKNDYSKMSLCADNPTCYYKQLQKAKNYILDLEVENKKFANQLNENNEKYCKITKEKYKLLDENSKLNLQLDNYKNNPEMQKAITYFQTGEYDIQISILEKENKKLKEALQLRCNEAKIENMELREKLNEMDKNMDSKKEEKLNITLTFQEITNLYKMIQEKIKNKDCGYVPAISILLCGEYNLIIKAASVNDITKEVMKATTEKREPKLLEIYQDITDKEKFEYTDLFADASKKVSKTLTSTKVNKKYA